MCRISIKLFDKNTHNLQKLCAKNSFDDHLLQGTVMNIHLALTPLISLIAGILILVMPRLLNFIVALYLIVIGLIGLFGNKLHF